MPYNKGSLSGLVVNVNDKVSQLEKNLKSIGNFEIYMKNT